jgi:hypothetical protein
MFHLEDPRRSESCYFLLYFQSQGVEAKCKENEEETESWTRDEKKDEEEEEEEEEERDDGGDSMTNLLLQIAGRDLSIVTCILSHSQWFHSLDDRK